MGEDEREDEREQADAAPVEADPSGGTDEALGGPTADPGALGAVESIAEVTLAPVQELQHSPWLLRSAMLAQLASTIAAATAAWLLELADWWVFAAMGVSTNVLVGNIMRWRKRWGWLRRAVLTLFSCAVSFAWALLLVDRAQAGTRMLTRDDAASPWFWLPAALLAASFVLLLLHFVIGTRRDQAQLRAAASRARR